MLTHFLLFGNSLLTSHQGKAFAIGNRDGDCRKCKYQEGLELVNSNIVPLRDTPPRPAAFLSALSYLVILIAILSLSVSSSPPILVFLSVQKQVSFSTHPFPSITISIQSGPHHLLAKGKEQGQGRERRERKKYHRWKKQNTFQSRTFREYLSSNCAIGPPQCWYCGWSVPFVVLFPSALGEESLLSNPSFKHICLACLPA